MTPAQILSYFDFAAYACDLGVLIANPACIDSPHAIQIMANLSVLASQLPNNFLVDRARHLRRPAHVLLAESQRPHELPPDGGGRRRDAPEASAAKGSLSRQASERKKEEPPNEPDPGPGDEKS